jgi:hypothetical protein
MHCPDCKGDQVIAATALWDQGTAGINASTVGVGVGTGLGVGVGRTKGTTTTTMAGKHGPPRKNKLFWPSVFIIIGCLFVGNAAGASGDATWKPIFMWVGVGVAIAIIVTMVKGNEKTYAAGVAVWQKKWVCLRCGHSAERAAFAATQSSAPAELAP